MNEEQRREVEREEIDTSLPPSELQSYAIMRKLGQMKNLEHYYEREDEWN